ncbi:DgyrCDS4781 [Dimorphilus gyrociliatus]|uniref:DgyrCDS4781 n=1 Tax=Dimorphilus gyrociliatus TaxID=2664684 RepID=A0A7I8VKM6_9ANNE|nr:DgyrCDS4781 [Dimorphilus gyrociliatus]
MDYPVDTDDEEPREGDFGVDYEVNNVIETKKRVRFADEYEEDNGLNQDEYSKGDYDDEHADFIENPGENDVKHRNSSISSTVPLSATSSKTYSNSSSIKTIQPTKTTYASTISTTTTTTTTPGRRFVNNDERVSIANLNVAKKQLQKFTIQSENNKNTLKMEDKRYDSVIEKEILLDEERELQLKKERGIIVNSQDFQEMTEVDRHTHVHKDEINDELNEEDEHDEDEDEEFNGNYETNFHSAKEETLIEKEIRLAKEREEELRQQRSSTSQIQSPRPSTTNPNTPTPIKSVVAKTPTHFTSPSSTPTPNSTPKTNVNQRLSTPSSTSSLKRSSPAPIVIHESPCNQSTENRLARELREQEEKEEELRIIRKKMGLQTKVDGIETTPILPNMQKIQSPSINESPSSQHTEKTQSPHHFSESSYPPAKVKVAPLLEEDETDLSRFEVNTNETPIETEIRLAREREESFRREKGISPKVAKEQGSNSPHQRFSTGTPPNIAKTNSNQNYKTWVHSRIQNEIQLEQEREENLKHQGRIITTSKDSESDVRKYTEVTPTQPNSDRKSFGSAGKSILKHENQTRKLSDSNRPNSYKSPQNMNNSPRGSIDSTARQITSSSSMNFENTPTSTTRRLSSENILKPSPRSNDLIERELREMHEREEELRKQRTALGLYHKNNVQDIYNDDDDDDDIEEHIETAEVYRDEANFRRSSSSSVASSQNQNESGSAERARRKHRLEAEWNQKIQQNY